MGTPSYRGPRGVGGQMREETRRDSAPGKTGHLEEEEDLTGEGIWRCRRPGGTGDLAGEGTERDRGPECTQIPNYLCPLLLGF